MNGTAYTHIGLPPSSPLPSLASTLNFTFTSLSTPPCVYFLCARSLTAAPDTYSQWYMNCGPNAVNLYNLTTVLTTTKPSTTGVFYLPPGVTYFSVYSEVANGTAGQCGFSLQVAGNACVNGGYGAACMLPLLFNRTQNVAQQTIGGGSGSFTFAVRPIFIARSQLSLNITTPSPYAVTAYVRQAQPPYITASPLSSVYDYNVSNYKGNTLWVNITNPAARDVLPMYGPASLYRYFVTITANTSTSASTPATITFNETVCPSDLLNPYCATRPDQYAPFGAISVKIPIAAFSAGVRYGILNYPDVEQRSIKLGVVETEGNAVPCLLLRLGAVPSLSEYDVQVCPTADSPSTVYYSSQETLVHDVPWFLALWYKTSVSATAVAVWTDLDCPDDCSGHGTCVEHRCVCQDDYVDYNCADVAQHYNALPQLMRALIPVVAILGAIALGCGICYYFKSRSDAHWEMRARLSGYRLANGVAADGGGGDGGGGGGGGGGSGGNDWRGPGGRGGFGSASGGSAAPPAPAARPSQGFGPRGNIHRL